MNVIARLEYELAYYDSAVHRFNHYTTRTPKRYSFLIFSKILLSYFFFEGTPFLFFQRYSFFIFPKVFLSYFFSKVLLSNFFQKYSLIIFFKGTPFLSFQRYSFLIFSKVLLSYFSKVLLSYFFLRLRSIDRVSTPNISGIFSFHFL